jgi:hypothetical protein
MFVLTAMLIVVLCGYLLLHSRFNIVKIDNNNRQPHHHRRESSCLVDAHRATRPIDDPAFGHFSCPPSFVDHHMPIITVT